MPFKRTLRFIKSFQRRSIAPHIRSVETYKQHTEQHPDEMENLFQALLSDLDLSRKRHHIAGANSTVQLVLAAHRL